ncbi:MAG TPA: thermonuclease family protein [Xanthobacteraceae bacterium]|nr:thermonuclease family protein [Xanthobacteraceae bacterium]
MIATLAAGFVAMYGGTPARADDQALTPQGPDCGGDEIARGTVAKILDGRTFVLEDGREVRLAAIEVVPAPGPQDRADPAGRAAAAALGALAAGDQVVLRRAESGSDRYGRLLAYAYTLRDGDEFLLQGELVAEGLARVSMRIASPCAGDLLDREKAAREAKLGLWADPYYEVLDAEMPKDALAHRGRFALVEGKVASVRESGPTIYVNFGRRRIGDITVTILKRNERSFAAAGLDLRGLAGRRIRVRGWIETRGGERAWIEAERPEQIEMAD